MQDAMRQAVADYRVTEAVAARQQQVAGKAAREAQGRGMKAEKALHANDGEPGEVHLDGGTFVRRDAARREHVAFLNSALDFLDAYPSSQPLPTAAGEKNVAAGGEGAGETGEWVSLDVGTLLGMSSPAAWHLVRDAANLRSRHPRLWAAFTGLEVEDWQVDQPAPGLYIWTDRIGRRWAVVGGHTHRLPDSEPVPEVAVEDVTALVAGPWVNGHRRIDVVFN